MQFFKKWKEKEKKEGIEAKAEAIFEKHVENVEKPAEVLPPSEEALAIFRQSHQNMVHGMKQIMRDYYIIKLFSYIALDETTLKEKLYHLDTFYFEYMKDIENFGLAVDALIQDASYEARYFELKQFIVLIQNKRMQLTDFIFNIRLDHYENIKVATLGIVHNKTGDEIKQYYDDIASIIKSFKDIREAAEFIYFNSGEELTDAIDFFLKLGYAKENQDLKRLSSLEFFKKYTYVLTLTMREWVELINNMKFTIKTIGKIDTMRLDRAKKKYEALEKKCFILMLYFELVASDKSLRNFEMV